MFPINYNPNSLSPLKSIIQYNRFIIDNAKLTYPIIEGTYPFYTFKRKRTIKNYLRGNKWQNIVDATWLKIRLKNKPEWALKP